MCYGDSILRTCPHCSATDQTFEFHGCYSGSSPTETWWILPCAIIEEVPVTVLCEDCLRCFHWLESLDTDFSSCIPLVSSDDPSTLPLADAESCRSLREADLGSIASIERKSSGSDPLRTSENHLRLICEWYENIEASLLPLKNSFSSMGACCIATRNADLIVKLGILEAEVEITLADALKKVEYVIETNTWIRQTTDDESKLKAVDPEEWRAAMFEMRMNCNGLLDDGDGSADTVTRRIRYLACEVCDELRAVEDEIGRVPDASSRSKAVDETNERNLMSKVRSLILG